MTNKSLSRQCGRRHERFCDRPPPSSNRPLAHPPRQPSPISSHLEPSTRNCIVTVIASGRLVRGGRDCGMKPPPDPHYRHRFSAEIISHAIWLYHVFSLSLRDVELLLAERGIVVSYETVRRWCQNVEGIQ
jgi:hypothetical protein